MENLIPKRQHVLRLIPALRDLLSLSPSWTNSLGHMHRLPRPEDRQPIEHWHEEDVDVKMTMKQAGTFFDNTRKRLRKSGI